MASREWVGRDVIAMGEIDPGFAVCPRAQQHLHPRDHPSPTTLFHVALQPDSTLRALSPSILPSLSISLPLFLSLSLALSFVLLLGGRSSTFSRSNPRKTFPAGSHRANPASPLHPLSFVRPPRPESRSYLTYTRVYLRVDLRLPPDNFPLS